MGTRLTPTVKCEICYERFKALSSHVKRHKISLSQYKEKFPDAPVISPLTRRRMQLARLRFILKKRGNLRKPLDKSTKLALKSTGRPHTEEAKEKIRQARLGTKQPLSTRLAISASLLGHEVSEETRAKLRAVVFTKERRQKISASQSAEKSNSWKGGKSRHLYMGKGKFRLKKIFGEPLRCFFPDCDKVEGQTTKSVDCHHLDGDHENNPLDGTNWLPLCRRHHMLVDGRLNGTSDTEVQEARKAALQAHADYLKKNYTGEIKTYHE